MQTPSSIIAGVLGALIAGPVFAQAPVAVSGAPAAQAPVAASGAPAAPGSGPTIRVCGGAYEIGPPVNLPPAGSGPVAYILAPCFEKQGNVSLIEPETYLYYIQTQQSLPSRNEWRPYNQQAEQTIHEDFLRLWGTNFLDDLSIEAVDYPFSNGVIGKVIVYNMEERQRIKVTVFNEGTKVLEQAKIEEKLREVGITIRLDSFVDQSLEKRVSRHPRDDDRKGFQDARSSRCTRCSRGPKTVALKFKVAEGPRSRFRRSTS